MKNYESDIKSYGNLLEGRDRSAAVLISDCVDCALSPIPWRALLIRLLQKKTTRIKQRTEPWMTSTMIEKIKIRDQISRQINNGNADNQSFSEITSLRNSIQRKVKKAKCNFLQHKLDENINNPKKLWRDLSSLGYSAKSKMLTVKLSLILKAISNHDW